MSTSIRTLSGLEDQEEPSSPSDLNFSFSIEEVISTNKRKIQEILANRYTSDESLLIGTLSFAQSKFSSYILNQFLSNIENLNMIYNNENSVQLAQFSKISPGKLVDRVWIDIHHPTIKFFQSQFHYLSKDLKKKANKSNTSLKNNRSVSGSNNVEVRKLFDRFVKFVSKCFEFYFSLVKEIINTYELSVYIPVKKLASTLKIEKLEETGTPKFDVPIDGPISSIVYVINKCILYIGDLSRYRTLVAKTYLPTTSISKEDNNNYSKSIELYKLSLLILPSLGDPYNHVAIIDNLKEDKFNVVYNFIRSSLSSKPLPIGFNNLLNFLSKQPLTNPLLKRFEEFDSIDRTTITKNDRMELLKSQFLILFNYYLLPNKWKLRENYLVNNHNIKSIENDFYEVLNKLDFHKQIFNDFYFKQLIILIGGFELLIDKKMVHTDLKQNNLIITDYLKFIFRYLDNFMKTVLQNWGNDSKNPNFSTVLLPLIRIMLCWFKERELPRGYLIQTVPYASTLAELLNNIYTYFETNPECLLELEVTEDDKLNNDHDDGHVSSSKMDLFATFETVPTRKRLFKEDVTLKEFKPINYHLNDFNDDSLYKKDECSVLALIGELPNETQRSMKLSDYLLRLLSIGCLGKKILADNKVGVKFNRELNKFDIPQRKVASKPVSNSNTPTALVTPTNKSTDSKKRQNGGVKQILNQRENKNSSVNGSKYGKPKNKPLTPNQLEQPQQQKVQRQPAQSLQSDETTHFNEPELHTFVNMVDSMVNDEPSNLLGNYQKQPQQQHPDLSQSALGNQLTFGSSIWSNDTQRLSNQSSQSSTQVQVPNTSSQQFNNQYLHAFNHQQNYTNSYATNSSNSPAQQHQQHQQQPPPSSSSTTSNAFEQTNNIFNPFMLNTQQFLNTNNNLASTQLSITDNNITIPTFSQFYDTNINPSAPPSALSSHPFMNLNNNNNQLLVNQSTPGSADTTNSKVYGHPLSVQQHHEPLLLLHQQQQMNAYSPYINNNDYASTNDNKNMYLQYSDHLTRQI